MNDKDKEEFDYFWEYKCGVNSEDCGKNDARIVWKAACEYKHSEIDVLLDNEETLRHHMNSIGYRELKKLQDENTKLRECLEWYADRKNCDNADFSHVEVDDSGEQIADGGYRARQVLKELDNNQLNDTK